MARTLPAASAQDGRDVDSCGDHVLCGADAGAVADSDVATPGGSSAARVMALKMRRTGPNEVRSRAPSFCDGTGGANARHCGSPRFRGPRICPWRTPTGSHRFGARWVLEPIAPRPRGNPPADAGAEGYNSPDGERHTLRSRDDHVRATDGSMQPCLEEGTCCSSTGRIRGARARRRLTRSKKPARRSGRDGARECAAMGPREPTDRSNPHPTSAARHPRPQRVADRIMLRRGGSAVADWGDLRS